VARQHADDDAAALRGPDIGLVVRRTFAGLAADDHAAVRRHRVGAAEEGAAGRCKQAFDAVHPAHAAPLAGFRGVPADDDRTIGAHRVGTTRSTFEAAEVDHSRAVLPAETVRIAAIPAEADDDRAVAVDAVAVAEIRAAAGTEAPKRTPVLATEPEPSLGVPLDEDVRGNRRAVARNLHVAADAAEVLGAALTRPAECISSEDRRADEHGAV